MSDKAKLQKRIYIIISIAILGLSVLTSVLAYRIPLLRLWESCKDFGVSVALIFCLFAGKDITFVPAVSEFPKLEKYVEYIGIDFKVIFTEAAEFFAGFFDLFNFIDYNAFLISRLITTLLFSVIFIPLGYIVLKIVYDAYLSPKDDSLGGRSKAYKCFIFFLKNTKSAFRYIADYFSYALSKKYYTVPFVLIWLLNFGVFSFIPDFLAFYLYFLVSLDAASFGYMCVRFLINALIILNAVPFLLLLVIVSVWYYRRHRDMALDELRHNESKNCGLIKELEYVCLFKGEVGKGKTTLLTDVILSLVNIFKTNSLKTLYKIDLYFPAFDFSSFRAYLIPKIEAREIFCLPNVDDVVNELFDRFHDTADASVLWGYDFELFGDSVDLGNRKMTLKEALITYGRAFLIYQNNNPTVANYSIRFKGKFDDSPYLKLWDGDFFKTEAESYYSHVLDSDIMRFGKKVDPNGKFNGSFGYGIWARTEAAKSYGNHLTNSEYRRDDDKANPLNDLVEYSAMMGRHVNSMVDFEVYFRLLMDEQRASDLTARIRELCSIISIEEKGELQLAITGYGWLFALRDKLKGFERIHSEYNNARADFTLAFMIPKLLVSYVNLLCERLENVYGYRELTLVKEGGMAYSSHDGVNKEPKRLTWYQANMKVYGDVFASDCYQSFFTDMQKSCGVGIEDIPTYQSLRPTMDDYDLQKDYFIMKMMMWKLYGMDKTETKQTQGNTSYDVYSDLIFDD